MLAVKPKILQNMNEETQTDVGRGESKKKSRGRKDKDEKTDKAFVTDTSVDEHNIMACEVHPDRAVEYFCRVHGALPCSRCAMELHRKCQGMEIIENVARQPNTFREMNTVSQKLEAATSQVELLRLGDKRVLTNLDGSVEKIQSELKQHKGKINRIIDSIEMRLMKQTDKVYNERTKLVSGHLDICNAMSEKLHKLRQAMDRVLESNNEAEKFVTLQKVKKSLQSLTSPLHNVQRDALDVQLYLKLGVDIEKTLEHIDKRMLIEMKTSRRKEQPTKANITTDTHKKPNLTAETHKKLPADSKLNSFAATVGTIKPKTSKDNPHKFLAQRNFRPYKVRPYTVEKSALLRSQLKSRASLASVRRLKPLIVISTENVNSPKLNQNLEVGSVHGENINDDFSDNQSTADITEQNQNELTRSNHNKTISRKPKESKYLWGRSTDRKEYNDNRSIRTLSAMTTASKATIYSSRNNQANLYNSRYNQSVLQIPHGALTLEQSKNYKAVINPYTGLPNGPRRQTTQRRYKTKETSEKFSQNRRKSASSPVHTNAKKEDSDVLVNDMKSRNTDGKTKDANNTVNHSSVKSKQTARPNNSKSDLKEVKPKENKRISENGDELVESNNNLYPVPEKSGDDETILTGKTDNDAAPANFSNTKKHTTDTVTEKDTTRKSKNKTASEEPGDKLIKTKSADRLETRKSSGQVQRAKSDFSVESRTNSAKVKDWIATSR